VPSPKSPTEPGGTREIFSRFLRRTPKQSRSRALVDALATALEEQLARTDDPDGWTLEAIVDRAGVGVGSFYEYFAGKDSLLGVLVGQITERNFHTLLAALDGREHDSLEATVRHMAEQVATTYLAHPTTTRAAVLTIARLGLMGTVVHERDRFAGELAIRARRFLPHADDAALNESMRLGCDAVMGVVVTELIRTKQPDVARCARALESVGIAVLRARHPDRPDRSESRGDSGPPGD